MPVDKNNVEELNKTSLFNGSIIKTYMEKKKHIAVAASIKQMAEPRSHKMTRLSTKDGFIFAQMPQAPRTRSRFDHPEGRISGHLHHLKPSC